MIPVFTIEEIKIKLAESLNVNSRSKQPAPGHLGLMLAGDLKKALQGTSVSQTNSKVLGVLFSNPDIPFVKNEIIPALNQLHHHMSTHLDIFCSGYFSYAPPNEYPDRCQVIKLDGVPWEYSARAHAKLEKQFESMSAWKSNGETILLLIEVTATSSSVNLIFDHALELNLERMLKDGAITSVRELIYKLVGHLKQESRVWAASDKFGMGLMCEAVRGAILSTLPAQLKESYTHANHFAVRNLTKR